MQTTIAVDPHSRASRSTTWAAAGKPSPLPPTSVELTSPIRPAWPSAAIVAVGNAPRSTSAACLAAVDAMDSVTVPYSKDMTLRAQGGPEGSPDVVGPGPAGSFDFSPNNH